MFDGHLFIELHLEVDEKASLSAAHARATELEDDIRRATDPHALINIHIEPARRADRRRRRNARPGRAVQLFLGSLQSEYNEMADCHEVHVRSVDHKILVSCHCAMPGDLPVAKPMT